MTTTSPDGKHHRVKSSLDDFTLLNLEHPTDASGHKRSGSAQLRELELKDDTALPKATLLIVAEKERLEDGNLPGQHQKTASATTSLLSSLSDMDFIYTKFRVHNWNQTKFYSDYIKEGLEELHKDSERVVMLFESPSSSSADSSFHNRDKFKFHDWPPPKSSKSKGILGPCRYSLMNGTSFPAFLRDGKPPEGLLEHWAEVLPEVPSPSFVDKITAEDTAYAYLPVQDIKNHVNDPDTHYHLAGKDAIHLMTQKTTKLLEDTQTSRPCVVKTTHSMGSKGIFIINNDQDQAEFEQFLQDSGNPTFVVTDFVDIARNVACHFFMHPSGEITWFGSNENFRLPDGRFSSDSYLVMEDQKKLREMQLPFVEEVVQYCHTLGFWGFCGVDVLFDSKGSGYLVDINPRVTGSCPALMTLQILNKKYGFTFGLFRRSGAIHFYGTAEELFAKTREYNAAHEGKSRVVLHSIFDTGKTTKANIGVYGFDVEECKTVLNSFVQAAPVEDS